MDEIFIDLGFSTLIAILKKKASRVKYERAFYKVWTLINSAFPKFQDEDYEPPTEKSEKA